MYKVEAVWTTRIVEWKLSRKQNTPKSPSLHTQNVGENQILPDPGQIQVPARSVAVQECRSHNEYLPHHAQESVQQPLEVGLLQTKGEAQ